MSDYKYIDLFSGCGGLSLGLINSGWTGLFAIEKNKDAFSTYKHNLIDNGHYLSWPDWLSIKNHNIDELIENYRFELAKLSNEVDLVAGGPPCQGFSTAGRRIESDYRNSLVYSYLKFIKIVNPKVIFFENVKGFTLPFKKNGKKGVPYSHIVLNGLRKYNYKVQSSLVDFSDFGIPQKRERFIIIGVREDVLDNHSLFDFFELLKNNKESFFNNKGITLRKINIEDAISDLLKKHGTKKSSVDKRYMMGCYGNVNSDYQQYIRCNIKNNMPDSHRFSNHSNAIKERFEVAINERLSKKEYRSRFNLKKCSTKLLIHNEVAPTITTLPDDYIHYSEPRIMTVRECARIQSFPDTYEFKGKYTTGGKLRILEVPRYSQVGNAIPPLFSEQVGNILKDILK